MLIKIAENFKGKKIGIIGDIILDRFVWGKTERISPEAPIPVVLAEKETYALGGAANTANNIATACGSAFLVGGAGNDFAGKKLFSNFKLNKINAEGVFIIKNRPTTQKTRIISQNQQIVRIDREKKAPIANELEARVIDFLDQQIKNWDVLVVSDYGKGFITKNIALKILDLAKKHNKTVVGDIKPAEHAAYFKGIDLLAPNQAEALKISGESNVKTAGKTIQKKLNCNVLITRGAKGMTLFENEKIVSFNAKGREVFDVVGAGDTVVAFVSLALAAGASLEEAVNISSFAAGLAVGKKGTATVSLEEIKKELEKNYELNREN